MLEQDRTKKSGDALEEESLAHLMRSGLWRLVGFGGVWRKKSEVGDILGV